MEAPPSFTMDSIKLNNINCYEHSKNKIVGICNDKNCKHKNKYMCVDCIFDNHSGHVGIKINQIENFYEEQYKKYSNENISIDNEYKAFENNLKNKINDLKNKINNDLDLFYKNILQELKKTKLDNYEEMKNIRNNYPPNNKEQLNKIIEELLKLYNNTNSDNNKNKLMLEKKIKLYNDKLNEKFDSLKKYLDHFIKYPFNIKFEWSTKTYGSYGFYYILEEDNTKVTKISEGGTVTICRGTNPLEEGMKYKLDYFINYKKGDFDVGFGDEKIGSTCWIRNKCGYSVSSNGLFIDGSNNNSSINILSCKKVTFIIDLKNYNSEVLLDDKKVSNFNIRSDLKYYPMIAIRELDNSVKLKLSVLD